MIRLNIVKTFLPNSPDFSVACYYEKYKQWEINNLFVLFLLGTLGWVLWLWFRKRIVRSHRIAILATVILPTLLAIATVVIGLLNREALAEETEGLTIVDICLQVGFGLVAASTLSSIGFAIKRKWEIAKGTGFDSGIGFVVLLIVFAVAHMF